MEPFEAYAMIIPHWLEAEADVGSQELLKRLHPLVVTLTLVNFFADAGGEMSAPIKSDCNVAE